MKVKEAIIIMIIICFVLYLITNCDYNAKQKIYSKISDNTNRRIYFGGYEQYHNNGGII